MKETRRKEYIAPIDTEEVDELLAQSDLGYYFWNWDTIFKRETPLLLVYIGDQLSINHDKFRALMLDKQVRVKFINHSGYKLRV